MYHFDGTVWALVDSTLPATSGGVHSLWGNCQSDVWVLLHNEHGFPMVAHFDGTRWSRQLLWASVLQTGAVATSGPNDVWVTSALGTRLYHRSPADAASACGNGRLDPGETCDPPDGFTCGADCQQPSGCGDGAVTAGEQCDPPDGITCSTSCQFLVGC